MKGRRSDRGLERVLDVLVEEILEASDAEILAAAGKSPKMHATVSELRRIVNRASDRDDKTMRLKKPRDEERW